MGEKKKERYTCKERNGRKRVAEQKTMVDSVRETASDIKNLRIYTDFYLFKDYNYYFVCSILCQLFSSENKCRRKLEYMDLIRHFSKIQKQIPV